MSKPETEIAKIMRRASACQRANFLADVASNRAAFESDFGPALDWQRARPETSAAFAKAAAAFSRAGKALDPHTLELVEQGFFADYMRQGVHADTAMQCAGKDVDALKTAFALAERAAKHAKKLMAPNPARPRDDEDVLIREIARSYADNFGIQPSHAPQGSFAQILSACAITIGQRRLQKILAGTRFDAPKKGARPKN